MLCARVPLPSLIYLLSIFIVEFLAIDAASVCNLIKGEESCVLKFSFLIVMLEADSGSKMGLAAEELECFVLLSVMVCKAYWEPFKLIASGNCYMLRV